MISKVRRRGVALVGAAAVALALLSALTVGAANLPHRKIDPGVTQSAPSEPPGTRHEVRADALPPPVVDPETFNGPTQIELPGPHVIRTPEGFRTNFFAEALEGPRWMAVAGNGDVFVSESRANRVRVLRDADGDGRAELSVVFADGFDRPHGLAFQPGFLYVADTQGVWRIPYVAGDLAARARAMITKPGALGRVGNHWTRNITFSPDGERFYVTIGSRGNIRMEGAPSATIQQFARDGAGQTTFASGLRNPVGLAFYPGSNDLYTVVNERDQRGDAVVPDFFTRVDKGDFYGWPFAYTGRNAEPRIGLLRPDLVLRSKTPDLLFEAHSAPLGLLFYEGTQFPEAYRGDAFVALRGSWNRTQPTGYAVVRVPMRAGRPAGHYETFASGFWQRGDNPPEVVGRPVGLAMAADGSLLVTDDLANLIWRISYRP
jgi:glucose/arabinose dehydrogenase